jgi:hypothetical protein
MSVGRLNPALFFHPEFAIARLAFAARRRHLAANVI